MCIIQVTGWLVSSSRTICGQLLDKTLFMVCLCVSTHRSFNKHIFLFGSCCATWCTIMCQMSDWKPLSVACRCPTVFNWRHVNDLTANHNLKIKIKSIKSEIWIILDLLRSNTLSCNVTCFYWVRRLHHRFSWKQSLELHTWVKLSHTQSGTEAERSCHVYEWDSEKNGGVEEVSTFPHKPANTC